MPLTTRGALADAPVHWIVELEADSLPALEIPLYAHDRGQKLPLTTREAMERIGVRVAPDVALVSYIPSRGGVVQARSGGNVEFFVGLLTVLILLSWVGIAFLGRRERGNKDRLTSRTALRAR